MQHEHAVSSTTPYLSAAAAHAELCLSASCQEGEKHLGPPEDSDPNSCVKRQEDGVQGRGREAAPAPLTNPGTLLIQTLTA